MVTCICPIFQFATQASKGEGLCCKDTSMSKTMFLHLISMCGSVHIWKLLKMWKKLFLRHQIHIFSAPQ